MGFREATQRNQKFQKSTSISTSNINKVSTPSVTKRPSNIGQHTTDWRLRDVVKDFGKVPTVSADRGDDYKVEGLDTSKMSVYVPEKHDKNMKKEFNIFDTTTWFGEPSHVSQVANAETQKQTEVIDKVAEGVSTTAESYNSPEPFYKDPQPLPKGLSGQGSFYNPLTEKTTLATKPEGSELFSIPDYVGQVERTSYYHLGKNMDSETFKKTLNKQQINKFENSIQKEWSTLVRSGGVDDMSYLAIQQKITNSNLPIAEQQRLVGVYSKKKEKYQSATGKKSVKAPNEAEQLGFKIADGTITRKELDKWKLLTGSTPKGVTVKIKGGSMPKILTYEDLF
jgi:hypothetical protein